MFSALVALNIIHPGKTLVGEGSEFKSRKVRKMEKKQEKELSSDGGVMS